MQTFIAFVLTLWGSAFSFAAPSAESFSAYVRQYGQPEFFSSNGGAFDARLKLLDQAPAGARAQIATFAFKSDASVRQLARHLCLASQRGVRVELVVDGRQAGRPGLDDANDKSDGGQLNEDLLQYIANCGGEVHVHNLQTSYVEFVGFRLPNIFLDKRHEGRELGIFHTRKVLKRLSFLLERASALVEEELVKAGIHHDPRPLLKNFRTLMLGLMMGEQVPPLAGKLRANYEDILLDPLWAQITPEKVKEVLPKIEARFFADPVFGPFGEMVRRANRINHRKLFLVEHRGEACMILGGRNLGDHYLTEQATAFYDGDLMLCRHQGQEVSGVVDAAKESFNDLLTDFSDEYMGRQADNPVFRIRANPNHAYSSLVFPLALRPAGWRAVEYKGLLEYGDRVLVPEKKWADGRAVRGQLALASASGWHLPLASWDPGRDGVKNELLRNIAAEKKEIFIETAYAEFDLQIREALEAALKRGVKVEVITNSYFTSDGPSGMIRLLMSAWNERMAKGYPGLFRTRFTTVKVGRMSHFKFAAFGCQEGGNRAYLLGSHNFHPRSGNSDKEHMLAWSEPGSCQQPLASQSLVRSREEFYASLAKKKGVAVLETFPNLFRELTQVMAGGDPAKARMAGALLDMLYEEEGGVWRPRLSARAERVRRLLDDSWLHDLLGRIL